MKKKIKCEYCNYYLSLKKDDDYYPIFCDMCGNKLVKEIREGCYCPNCGRKWLKVYFVCKGNFWDRIFKFNVPHCVDFRGYILDK